MVAALRAQHPELADPEALIRAGQVLVDGFPVRNPASRVAAPATISLVRVQPLRGEAKLEAALAAFPVTVTDRVAADIGAAAGGFTRVLLRHGARRVYAVDAGHGQLVGSLRQDPRVVNLEAVNLGALGPALVPDVVDVLTIDVSYVSLAAAVPQLGALRVAPDADLIALVKPMFELGLAAPPPPERLPEAVARACAGIEAAGWRVRATIDSPVTGARGARELLLHAVRGPPRADPPDSPGRIGGAPICRSWISP